MSKNIIIGSLEVRSSCNLLGVHGHDVRTYEGEQAALGGMSREDGRKIKTSWRLQCYDMRARHTHEDWDTTSE